MFVWWQQRVSSCSLLWNYILRYRGLSEWKGRLYISSKRKIKCHYLYTYTRNPHTYMYDIRCDILLVHSRYLRLYTYTLRKMLFFWFICRHLSTLFGFPYLLRYIYNICMSSSCLPQLKPYIFSVTIPPPPSHHPIHTPAPYICIRMGCVKNILHTV